MTSQAAEHLKATVAGNIDRRIEAMGLTNREVALLVNCSEGDVWRWRRGKVHPSPPRLAALAHVLAEGDVASLYSEDAA